MIDTAAFWNDKYNQSGYVYGKQPNKFLQDHADVLPKAGRALAVADGEGRNSVFLAQQGLTVTAVDASNIAQNKAHQLATKAGVDVNFVLADLNDWVWAPAQYDLVAAIFIQFAQPKLRAQLFAGFKRTLKPGGLLMLHGYTPKQLDYGTGGPSKAELLYTKPLLQAAFNDMQVMRLATYESHLQEGSGHVGRSALIDLIARKP